MGRHSHTELLPVSTVEPGDSAPDPRPIEHRDVLAAPLWRSRMVISAVLIVVLIAGTWWLFRWLQEPAGAAVEKLVELPAATEDQTVSPAHSAAQAAPAPEVIVHVAGEVAEPGIVELPEGSRVVDALEAAGGATSDADLARLNLAATLSDGEQIMVPDGTDPAQEPVTGGTGSSAGSGGDTINLNTAEDTVLQTLPGVGPALSERIIAHRESVGPFTSMADLDAVSGIGPVMMEELEGLVSW